MMAMLVVSLFFEPDEKATSPRDSHDTVSRLTSLPSPPPPSEPINDCEFDPSTSGEILVKKRRGQATVE